MNVVLSYDSLWLYYKHSDKTIQDDILKQLNLEDYLPRVPVSVRKEVMKSAPRELVEQVRKVVPLTQEDETYRNEIARIFGRR